MTFILTDLNALQMKLVFSVFIVLIVFVSSYRFKSSIAQIKITKAIATLSLLSTISFSTKNSFAATSETTLNPGSTTFERFVQSLDNGEVNKVVFQGINPTYATAYYKNGEVFVVKEGFPYYNDPLSPSGPAQAIAKVYFIFSN